MILVFIRRPQPQELNSVRAVVQTVVDEVYGGLWAPSPIRIDDEGWELSWIAVVHGTIVGVVLTSGEWLDDLWVLREARGCGVGQRLLAQGEAEIVARGHETLRLRVVQSNAAAIEFYRRHGWRIAQAFPHEKFRIKMLEMFKSSEKTKDEAFRGGLPGLCEVRGQDKGFVNRCQKPSRHFERCNANYPTELGLKLLDCLDLTVSFWT